MPGKRPRKSNVTRSRKDMKKLVIVISQKEIRRATRCLSLIFIKVIFKEK